MTETSNDPTVSENEAETQADVDRHVDAATDQVEGGAAADTGAEPPAAPAPASRRARWSRWRRSPSVKREVLLALELAGLTAFAFGRPVLDSFGRSPETFVLHNATRSDILWFGLGVALVPVLVAVAVGLLVGLPVQRLAPRFRWAPHVVLVGVLAGVGAWRMGQDQTGWPGSATKLILLGVSVALLVGFLRWWPKAQEALALFLRYASIATLVFLLQFFTMSSTGELAFGSAPVVNVEIAESVAEGLGDDPPSVMYVVFDALPTMSLLDGEGQIDAETFPNFGALAEDSTFYRNNSAVAGFTAMALPALLTGIYPEPDTKAPPVSEDHSLFTLLAGNYNVHAKEQITRFCPQELCGSGESAGVGQLFDDALDWWTGGLEDPEERQFGLGGLDEHRYGEAEEWIADLDLARNGRPDLTFLHAVVPHAPWQFTEDGELYETPQDSGESETGTLFGSHWSESGVAVAEQRHMLMARAADRLLGQLLDKLEAEGTYDDTMVVVTADHGMSLTPETAKRAIDDGNEADIAWTPLLVKGPGQVEAEVNDDNLMAVDLMPTIADELGIELPWEADGLPADEAAGRDDTKYYSPHEYDIKEPPPGEELIQLDWRDHLDDVVGYDPATASGPDGVWRLTEHGALFGEQAADLEQESPPAGEVVVNWSENFDDVDLDGPLRLEVIAGTDLTEGEVVAFALNGTVAALGEVQAAERDPGLLVHGMLPPRLFQEGENELTAYLVDGPVGDEVLHPLDVSL